MQGEQTLLSSFHVKYRVLLRSKAGLSLNPSTWIDSSEQMPFFPHPEGAETAASKLVAVIMTPLFNAQAALAERNRKTTSDGEPKNAGTVAVEKKNEGFLIK